MEMGIWVAENTIFQSGRQALRAQKGISMPRGKNRRETTIAAQMPRNCRHHGGYIWKRE